MEASRVRRLPKALSLALVLGLSAFVRADAPGQLAWVRQFGTSGYDTAYAVAPDALGNVYVTGETPNLGGPSAGADDVYLAKFDAGGNRTLTKQFGTASSDMGRSIAVDGSGNIFVAGSTYGSLGGSISGATDAFVAKCDPAGSVSWICQVGTSGYDGISCTATDAAGNVYVAGYTEGALYSASAGGADGFLAKFSDGGTLLWARQFGTTSDDYCTSVAVSASDNVYVGGRTPGSLAGPALGGMDIYLVKYDSVGNLLWNRQFGSNQADSGAGVAIDASENVYVNGATRGSLGGANRGGYDAFVAKFDAAGDAQWTRQVGTPMDDWPADIGVDGSGNVYTAGQTRGSLGGSNRGRTDCFVVKYDPAGNLLFGDQLGTIGDDMVQGMTVLPTGDYYVCGYVSGGSFEGPGQGGIDAFLAKSIVPEPSTLALLGAGAAGLWVFARRRR